MLGRTFEISSVYVEHLLTRYAYRGANLNFIKVMEYSQYVEYDYIDWGILVWVKIPTRQKEYVIIAKYNYINNQLFDWFSENEAWLDFHTTEHVLQSLTLLNKGIARSGYVKDLNLASLKARLRLDKNDFHYVLKTLINNSVKDFRALRKKHWVISKYNRGKCIIASIVHKEQTITICVCYGVLHFISIDGVGYYTERSHYSRSSARYTNLAGGAVSLEKTTFGNYDYICSDISNFAN